VQRRYGPIDEVLIIQDVDKPVPRDNEVLVRVRASALHPDVWHAIVGLPLIYRVMGAGLRRPKQPVPGMDVAGVVEAIGGNVTRFKEGDAVFGATMFMRLGNGAALAEYASVREDLLAHKPAHVTFEAAASVPTPALITFMNLRPDRIGTNQHVLINGAGGNVGSLAVQMAKASGARVTGVDRTDKLAMIRSLGADHVIDHTKHDFTRVGEHYDLVLDVASTSSHQACKPILKPGGRYWVIGHDHFGTATGRVFGSIPRMIGFMLSSDFRKSEKLDLRSAPVAQWMETLRSQLDSGAVTPIVGKVFPLREITAAMRCLVEGQTVGRIVVAVDS